MYVWILACMSCIIIIIIITPNIFLAHTPAGAESDLNAAAAAPSQTEVTDLNCSDHSTTSKKKMARGELWWVSIWHALKIRPYDTLWCDYSTAAYDHSDPEEIAQT